MRFVINRSDALGDLLLTLPMAGKIKRIHPDAKIAFVVSERCRDLIGDHPWVDEIWPLEREEGFCRSFQTLWKRFRDYSPSVYLHVGGSLMPNICAFFFAHQVPGRLALQMVEFFLSQQGRAPIPHSPGSS